MNLQDRIVAIETAQHHIKMALALLADAGVDVRFTYVRDLKNDLQQEIWDIKRDDA